MAKDFFVDLSQPQKPDRDDRAEPRTEARADPNERTIRNVMVNRRTPGPRHVEAREPIHRPRSHRSTYLFVIAGIIIVGIVSLGIMAVLARSTVTVTPRVHNITFDQSAVFSAAPAGGTGLSYTVETVTLEETKVVAAQGVERVEDRATGNITVFNEYSDSPVRLIKNTRFETPSGLIYRIPASVVVPGKTARAPGSIDVTVIADSAGPTHNSAPVDRLTVPGLKSTPAMYSGVYAKAPLGMSGGFVGERPAVSAEALEGTRTELRAKLRERLAAEIGNREDVIALTSLAEVIFDHLPTSQESEGAKVGERLTAKVPVFNESSFATAIAQAVSADAGASDILLRPGTGFMVSPASTSTSMGLAGPIQFRIAGSATLVWQIDTNELKAALLGKDKDAFQPIVAQFPGVEKADAQVAPFWSSKFPADDQKLEVLVVEPGPTP